MLIHRQPDNIWRIDYQLHKDEATEEALRTQVDEQSTAGLYYDAMQSRPAKPVLKKADTH